MPTPIPWAPPPPPPWLPPCGAGRAGWPASRRRRLIVSGVTLLAFNAATVALIAQHAGDDSTAGGVSLITAVLGNILLPVVAGALLRPRTLADVARVALVLTAALLLVLFVPVLVSPSSGPPADPDADTSTAVAVGIVGPPVFAVFACLSWVGGFLPRPPVPR